MDQTSQILALIGVAALGILAVVVDPSPRPRRRPTATREPVRGVHGRHEAVPVVRDGQPRDGRDLLVMREEAAGLTRIVAAIRGA